MSRIFFIKIIIDVISLMFCIFLLISHQSFCIFSFSHLILHFRKFEQFMLIHHDTSIDFFSTSSNASSTNLSNNNADINDLCYSNRSFFQHFSRFQLQRFERELWNTIHTKTFERSRRRRVTNIQIFAYDQRDVQNFE